MKHLRALTTTVVIGFAVTMSSVAPAAEPGAGRVSVNGTPLRHAVSFIDATVEVTEFRDGTNPNVVKLIPGAKRYTVCIVSKEPLKMFDAELPVADTPDRFTLMVEDGREFSSCLLTGLKQLQKPKGRIHEGRASLLYKYCLRCEDITVPTP